MVRTSGNWLRDGKTLILDDVAIAGLEYTLPKNWQQLWMETTPGWLNSLQLKRFSASRNLIIDIDLTSRAAHRARWLRCQPDAGYRS